MSARTESVATGPAGASIEARLADAKEDEVGHHACVSIAPTRTPASATSQEARTVPIAAQVRAAVPRPVFGHAAPLSQLERFVLSKVDARRTVTDIAILVSLAPAEVAALFLSLSGRGAVRLDGAPRAASSTRLRAPGEPGAASGGEVVEELSDGDLEEVFDTSHADYVDDPHAASFRAPTVAGSMPAITEAQASAASQAAPRPAPRPSTPPPSSVRTPPPPSRIPPPPSSRAPMSAPPFSGARPTIPRPGKP
jgi:hypothetical protein